MAHPILGNKVRDSITGFFGVAIGRTEWLYGCTRIGIEAPGLKPDGTLIGVEWFDEQRVEIIVDQAPAVSPTSTAESGGPHDAPTRAADPARPG
jgi:hypothetical protein